MAGRLVPLVLLPRFSSFAGNAAFTTVPVDVTDYAKAVLTVWRGPVQANATFGVTCEESSDAVTWTTCAGTNVSGYDPGAGSQGVAGATLGKRWLRLRVVLGAIQGPRVTCWAAGHLEAREP